MTAASWVTALLVLVLFSTAYFHINQVNPAPFPAAIFHTLVLFATAAAGWLGLRLLATRRLVLLLASSIIAFLVATFLVQPSTTYDTRLPPFPFEPAHRSIGYDSGLSLFLLLTIGIPTAVVILIKWSISSPNPIAAMASFAGAWGFAVGHALASLNILLTLQLQVEASRIAHSQESPAGWMLPAAVLLCVAFAKRRSTATRNSNTRIP